MRKQIRNLLFVFFHEIEYKIKGFQKLKHLILFNPLFDGGFRIIILGETFNHASEIVECIHIAILQIEKLLISILRDLILIPTLHHLTKIGGEMLNDGSLHLGVVILSTGLVRHEGEYFIVGERVEAVGELHHGLMLEDAVDVGKVQENDSGWNELDEKGGVLHFHVGVEFDVGLDEEVFRVAHYEQAQNHCADGIQ